jgi:2-haloacid dehalogenase
MALPKDVKFVTFDCYGSLIDWESGVYDAFQKEADRDGFTIDRDVLIPRFIDVQRDIQRGSYELYAEVLRRTAVRVAAELSWDLEPSRSNELGILSNIDDKLLGATRRHFRADFDLVVTAQQVRSYKPDPAHFKECARRIGPMKKNWVHIAAGYPTDIEPCIKEKVPVIWVNRHGEEIEGGRKPDAEVKTFRDAGKLLKAA